DLVITADIPLASEVIDKKGIALNPRGERYTTENIRQRLNMRDFMDTLRSSGIQTGGPAALNQRDRQAFANELDRWLLAFQRSQKAAR
ncbi:MAG: YaiI/YqxD family protein, partial [Plesiomonas sp.]